MLVTTLEILTECKAHKEHLVKLRASLSDNHHKTDLITLSHILSSNGLEFAIWVLRTQDKKYARQFAQRCAERAKKWADENQFAAPKAVGAARYASYAADDAKYADIEDTICVAGKAALRAAEAAAFAAHPAMYNDAYTGERQEQKKIYLEIVCGE